MINIGTILLSAPLMTGGADTVNAHDLIMAVRDDSATHMSLKSEDSPSLLTLLVSSSSVICSMMADPTPLLVDSM